MINSIWGYGDLKILQYTDTDNIVTFANCIHKLYFQKINIRQTAITGLLFETQVTYRPVVEAQIVIGCHDNDIENIIQLVDMMNESLFVVYPQNSNNNTYDNDYVMYLDSLTIDFLHLATTLVGQIITLKFIGKHLVQLPTNYSNPQTYTMIDYNDDIYIDNIGDTLIMQI